MNRYRSLGWLVLTSVVAAVTVGGAGLAPTNPASAAGLAASHAALAVPSTDLVIDALEVTQSIQDLNNSVPLVKGKSTFVRVFAHSTSGVHPTTAQLKVQVGNNHSFLLPIAPGGPLINIRPTYNRLIPSHAFLFELPLAVTFAQVVTLTATINPALTWHASSPDETTYANNSLAVTVHFDPVPKLHLVIANQPLTFNNLTYVPRGFDRWKTADWLSRAFPLSNVKVIYRTLPTLAASRVHKPDGWYLTFPNCGSINLYLAYHTLGLYGNSFYPPLRTMFYGLIPDDLGWTNGCAPLGGMLTQHGYSHVGSGPGGSDAWGWDFDGSYADWLAAHEIGHSFSRPHVRGGPGSIPNGCGGESKAVTHNPNGAISLTYNFWDPAAVFGFDTLKLALGQNPILSPFSADLMTYCDYRWISKPTYVQLKSVFAASQMAATTTPRLAAGSQNLLVVFGTLDPSGASANLLPTTVLLGAPIVEPPAPGNHAIVLYDGEGDELARYPFAPSDPDAGQPVEPEAAGEPPTLAVLVPAVPEATLLQVEGPGGSILAEVQAGLAVPAVQLTAPNGSESFSEFDEVTVTWTATDEDGDPLTVNVEYSADNGTTWEPVALFITATQVTVPHENLPAGDSALFRVTASDGLHASQDTSNAVFSVLNHPPEGEIIVPASDVTIAVSQTISFEARAYDADLGSLDEELEWESDQDGSLGGGAVFSTADLNEGLHQISLIAHDGSGDFALDQVSVTVVATPNDLPTPPDALLAGPDLVFLGSGNGAITATLYLDNLNLGQSLAWEVVSSESWVNLSATSGVAPQDLTVGTSITWQDFGQHKSLLTFTSPTDAFDPVYVVVIVDNPLYPLHLPLLRR